MNSSSNNANSVDPSYSIVISEIRQPIAPFKSIVVLHVDPNEILSKIHASTLFTHFAIELAIADKTLPLSFEI